VVGFSISQKTNDINCLIPNLNLMKERLDRLPRFVVADAGYGSEENYADLEEIGQKHMSNTSSITGSRTAAGASSVFASRTGSMIRLRMSIPAPVSRD
jgi:hypothetical protein